MMDLVQTGNFSPHIDLPVSKSILNRQLVLRKLCGFDLPAPDPNWPDDAKLLHMGLTEKGVVDLQLAGTAVRFLLAYHAIAATEDIIITGSARMQERPMKPLIDALRSLGANIKCLDKEGFLPVRLSGSGMKGGHLVIDNSQSSQFASALMMIAPFLKGGLHLQWQESVSKSYIALTAQVLRDFGFAPELAELEVFVPEGQTAVLPPPAETDWSAAAFLYSWFALSNQSQLDLPGLSLQSAQGDAAVARWFEAFGVFTESVSGGVRLTKKQPWSFPGKVHFGASSTPDLVQATALCAAGLGVSASFTGISSLVHKETNRIEALRETLQAGSLEVQVDADSLSFTGQWKPSGHVYKTYGDHRMAMALAPLAQVGKLTLDDPKVVSKSFTNFWQVMESLGLKLTTSTP